MSIPEPKLSSMMSNEVDVAACWREIEELGHLLNEPGQIQVQCAKDTRFGPLIAESTNKMMAALISITDFNSKITEEHQNQLAEQAHSITGIYTAFVTSRIARASDSMQRLPVESLFVEMSEASTIKSISPEAIADLKSRASEINGGESGGPEVMAAKMKPALNVILAAGMNAAGGHAEFAKIQMEIIKSMPEGVRKHPNLMLTAQFMGATAKAISDFTRHKNMAMASIIGPLEAVMAARRLCGIGFAGTWGQTAESTTAFIGSMMVAAVSRCLESEQNDSATAATKDIIEGMMKSANHPGNGTVN